MKETELTLEHLVSILWIDEKMSSARCWGHKADLYIGLRYAEVKKGVFRDCYEFNYLSQKAREYTGNNDLLTIK